MSVSKKEPVYVWKCEVCFKRTTHNSNTDIPPSYYSIERWNSKEEVCSLECLIRYAGRTPAGLMEMRKLV